MSNASAAVLLAATLSMTTPKAEAFQPGTSECISPSGAGGRWDMTCRTMDKALQWNVLKQATH